MTATVTVTPQPLNQPPRILVQVAGLAGTAVTVSRVNADGSTYVLRTANPATLVSGAWTGYDYESPFAQAGVYTATNQLGVTASASVAALREYGVQTPWLIHPGIPALSMPVTVAKPGPLPVTDVRQGVFDVIGRTNPVIRTDGKRRAPTFTLTLSTYSWAEQDTLAAILATASTLLLQITYPDWERGDYYWIAVSTVTPSRPVDYYGADFMQWALSCTATGAPAGLLQPQWTCGGLLASVASCAAVLTRYATCNGVLTNQPGT